MAAPGKGQGQQPSCAQQDVVVVPRWQRGDWCDGLEHLTQVRHDCTMAWESEEEANLVYGRGESVPVPMQ